MGLGKLTRTAGKVGLALEVGRYVSFAGRALVRSMTTRKQGQSSDQNFDRADQSDSNNGNDQN